MSTPTAEDLFTRLTTMTEPYHLTDLGNARRFAEMHLNRARYVFDLGKWIIWDGKRYKVDNAETIYQLADETIREIYHEASYLVDKKRREELVKWGRYSESRARLKAMVEGARTFLSVTPNELDADPFLFNCQSGVIDLRTGDLYPHDPTRMITKLSPAHFDPHGMCPHWECFNNLLFGNDEAMQFYLQKMGGYFLTGSIDEHALFFPYGLGANGKTTYFEMLLWILGDYGQVMDIEALLVNGNRGSSATPYTAALKGIRLAVANEVPEGRRINESLIKNLSGGDTITARHLYCEPFSFHATHKIVVIGNYKPKVTDSSEGFWRRMKLIPFDVTIPPEQRRPMSEILGEFQEEAAGILSWLVSGCLHWQSTGLNSPEPIRAATAEYRNESDLINQFLDDRCEIHPNYTADRAILFSAWRTWCEQNGEAGALKQSKRWFIQQLTRRGYQDYGAGHSGLAGLRLRQGNGNE